MNFAINCPLRFARQCSLSTSPAPLCFAGEEKLTEKDGAARAFVSLLKMLVIPAQAGTQRLQGLKERFTGAASFSTPAGAGSPLSRG